MKVHAPLIQSKRGKEGGSECSLNINFNYTHSLKDIKF